MTQTLVQIIFTHPLVVVEVDVVVVVEIVVVLSEMVEDGKELLKTFVVVRGAAVVLLALNFPWTLANNESFILTLVLLWLGTVELEPERFANWEHIWRVNIVWFNA